MTQAQLARILEVQQNVVARLENGGRPDPQFSTIIAVCRALGMSVDALAAEAGLTDHPLTTAEIQSRHRDVLLAARRSREQLAELEGALDALEAAAQPRPRRRK